MPSPAAASTSTAPPRPAAAPASRSARPLSRRRAQQRLGPAATRRPRSPAKHPPLCDRDVDSPAPRSSSQENHPNEEDLREVHAADLPGLHADPERPGTPGTCCRRRAGRRTHPDRAQPRHRPHPPRPTLAAKTRLLEVQEAVEDEVDDKTVSPTSGSSSCTCAATGAAVDAQVADVRWPTTPEIARGSSSPRRRWPSASSGRSKIRQAHPVPGARRGGLAIVEGSSSTTTATCTRRAASCCGAWSAPRRRATPCSAALELVHDDAERRVLERRLAELA